MSDDDNTRYSGSRWEPGPADQVPAEPTAPGATPSDTTPPEQDAAWLPERQVFRFDS